MKFKDIQRLEDDTQGGISSESKITLEQIDGYLEFIQRKENAKSRPFEFFYEDVIEASLDFDFNEAIGVPYYNNAEKDALCCLNICDEFNKISPYKIYGWLQNALKFIDNIVLHYIQEYLKQVPKKYDSFGQEKSRYKQLSESKAQKEISEAGYILINLYDMRNKLEHRTKVNADGTQELIRPKYGKFRQKVRKLYPLVLTKILKGYKENIKE